MRGLGAKTIAIRDEIKKILAEIQPATVRAVCYRLFVAGLIPEMTTNEVCKISRKLVALREDSIVPWSWVVDETRSVERVPCWRDFEHHFGDFVSEHTLDPWVNQLERIIIVSEKGTVRGTLAPVIEEMRIPMLVAHGFSSATAAHDLAVRSKHHNRPLRVFYVGDFDPSGMYMSEVDLPERLTRYGGNIEITRIAIVKGDMADLPDFSANDKMKNPNRKWYVRAYGDGNDARCVELDAMPPPALRARVRDAVFAHVDMDAWAQSMAREQEDKARLAACRNRIISMLEE